MDDLLKEAIADAKAVRQTAFENAKIALEEAFTPKIQSMLSKKIQKETEDYDEEEEAEEEGEAEAGAEGGEDEKEVDVAVGDSGEEAGGEDVPVEDEEEVPAEEADEVEAEEEEEAPAEEGDDEDSLDLEAIIRELEGEETEEEEEPTEENEDEVEETIELNGKTYRVVNEEEESDDDDDDDDDDDETVDEQSDSSKIGTGDNKVDVADSGDEEDPGKSEKSQVKMESFDVDSKIFEEEDEEAVEEDIDLEEVLKSLSEEEETEEGDDEVQEENVKLKAELGEHRKVVKYLKSKLNEINLLNAKLLFTNKLFKAYNLDNDEKMKVVETFDRAGNLREIKLVFSTLAESFGYNVTKKTGAPVKNISEGASKAGGTTKPSKKVISEGNALSNRFKKLAGII